MDVKQAITTIAAAGKAVPLVNKPTDSLVPGEIRAERTANARIFPAPNGQRIAHVFGIPIHFKDEDGLFKAIDTAVKRKPLADAMQTHTHETKSGVYHAHFKADKPWDYRLEIGDGWIEYEALFKESESLDIQVETTKIGIKETITLKDKNTPTTLSWRVTQSGTAITTPPPTAKDVNGKDVRVTVSWNKDVLIYDIDTKDAVFPIELDPTSVVATNDGYLLGQSAAGGSYESARDLTTASGYGVVLRVGQDYYPTEPDYIDYIYNVARSFLSFAVPAMASISYGAFRAYPQNDASVTDFYINIFESTYSNPLVLADFDQFSGWQSSGAYNGTLLNDSWDTINFGQSPCEITFNASGLAAILAKSGSTFKIAILSKKDVDSSAPTGQEWVNWYSSYYGGNDPYLSITYTPPAVVAPKMHHYRQMRG